VNKLGKVKLLILLSVMGIALFFVVSSYAQSQSYTPDNNICENGVRGPDNGETFDRSKFINEGLDQDCYLCFDNGVCNNADSSVDYGEDLRGCSDCSADQLVDCVSNNNCPVCDSGEDRICRNPGTTDSFCSCEALIGSGNVGECQFGVSRGPSFEPDNPDFFEVIDNNVDKNTCVSRFNALLAGNFRKCGDSFPGGVIEARHLTWKDELVRFDLCSSISSDELCKKEDVRARVASCTTIEQSISAGQDLDTSCSGSNFFVRDINFETEGGVINKASVQCCRIEVTC